MSNAKGADWKIIGAGLALIVIGAALIMFLPLSGRRVLGIIILLIVGLGLCVAGSPDSKSTGNRRAD
jgi:hypothetical protein